METINSFTWIDFYTAFASKLLEYKNDRQTLIEKIRKVYDSIERGTPDEFPMKKNDGSEDVDPFTIFGLFNRSMNEKDREAIIGGLIREFSISAKVPDDFSGITGLHNAKPIFYSPEAKDRQEHDIDNLWAVFASAIALADEDNAENRKKFCAACNQAWNQHTVGKNITIVFYWIRPDTYLGLSDNNLQYLRSSAHIAEDISEFTRELERLKRNSTSVQINPPRLAEKYLELRDKCVKSFSSGSYKSFYELAVISSERKSKPEKKNASSEVGGVNNGMTGQKARTKGGTNIIYYGVPGSGKSNTIDERIKDECNKDPSIVERVVFHPDYSYADFVGQILPRIKKGETAGRLEYVFEPGPFTKILKKAHDHPENMYYLVIEEINRGNAPAIFGDIFQLLDREDDGSGKYHISNYDMATVVHKDENKVIKMPANLTLFATMNTSDQNVFTLDTAFQRRWEMRLVKNDVRAAKHSDDKICDGEVSWGKFAEVTNEEIIKFCNEMGSSEDKRLGAYFAKENELSKDKFPQKVLKYLWDDVFKMRRSAYFNKKYYL